MDTITQAALGACIAQAGFRHKLGSKAIIVGVVCGLLPDFDFLLSIGSDRFTYLATHRGLTHSLFILPFFALIMAWLSMKWGTWSKNIPADQQPPSFHNYWTWYHLCFWALITHPLLDLFTSYGTQILTPISNERFTLDGVSIIDPLYTFPLLIAIIIGCFNPYTSKRSYIWARGALIMSSLYLCLGLYNSWDARQNAFRQLSNNYPHYNPVALRVSPTLLNNQLWRILAKDNNGRYAVGFFSSLTKAPIQFHFLDSAAGELVDKAINSREGKILEWFSVNMLRAQTITADNQPPKVILMDMRLGLVSIPDLNVFSATFEFDDQHNIKRVYTDQSHRERLIISDELSKMWQLMWNQQTNDPRKMSQN